MKTHDISLGVKVVTFTISLIESSVVDIQNKENSHEEVAEYVDVEETFYSQCVNTKTSIQDPLIPFEEYIGKYGPSGSNIRDLYNVASYSDATFNGIFTRLKYKW